MLQMMLKDNLIHSDLHPGSHHSKSCPLQAQIVLNVLNSQPFIPMLDGKHLMLLWDCFVETARSQVRAHM